MIRKLVFLVLTIILVGCQQQQVQIANPASVHCNEVGGDLDILTNNDGGQIGICNLPDGTECEEWELFRGECPQDKTNTKGCQEDAKVCPDGSTVVRDPNKNCEFTLCPQFPDEEIAQCESDEDCVPDAVCHPKTCINKMNLNQPDEPLACTMMFDEYAAYSPEDCFCSDGVCFNRNFN